jgi:glycosyltransferase involved in cell wall biosynthesis
MNHEISVITSTPYNSSIDSVNVYCCRSKNYKTHICKIAYESHRSIKIAKIISQIKPEITHIHSFDYIHPLMISLSNIFYYKLPNLVVSTWGTDVIGNNGSVSTWRGVLSKRLLLRQSKLITATTQFLAEATSKLVQKGRIIHVVPFGIDCKQFSKKNFNRNCNSKTIRIGFIKHLKPKYGAEFLIKAMSGVVKTYPNTELFLVGKGELETDLKNLTDELKLRSNIKFFGHIEYDMIPGILSDVDIFVMPSIFDSETFGVAAIEAQAMEIPVVASNVGGIPEAVIHNRTGILVEAKNVDTLANTIKFLIDNPRTRKKMGRAGRQYVLANFNIEQNAKKMESLYQSILYQ